MSLVQQLVFAASTADGPEAEHARLMLDLAKFIAQPMLAQAGGVGLVTNDPGSLAKNNCMLLEEAARIVVRNFRGEKIGTTYASLVDND